MKKLTCLLLSLLLTMSFSLAQADSAVVFQDDHVSFDIALEIPEGYQTSQSQAGRYLYVTLLPDDAARPEFSLSVAYSESSEGASIDDMSDEFKEIILEYASEDFADPLITSTVTKKGSLVYLLDENGSESDYATAVTVHQGYFITISIHKADFSALTEDDIALALNVLGNLEVTDKP